MPLRGVLGPYTIETELGSGGMGTVYRARLETSRHGLEAGTRVALKVIHPHLLNTGNYLHRFAREGELGRRVVHPNVVRTYATETLEDARCLHHALAMELVDGQTLHALVEELERVPESLCRHIGREVARGLHAIHTAGAVHRDLKPENVILTPDHRVKIMDLGVAHLQEAVIRLTHSEGFAGSIEYAAPEQFQPDGEGVDFRSDLYSLGVLLYELVTGAHPFRAPNASMVLHKVLQERLPMAGEFNGQVSTFFEELLATLMARSPNERLASAEELVRVLDEAEKGPWWSERAQRLRTGPASQRRRAPARHETAVFGRDGEVAVLENALDHATRGEGRVVLVRGEAGIGKSRLVEEFLRRVEGTQVHLLAGAYAPGGLTTVAGAFSSAFRNHIGEDGLASSLRELFGDRWLYLPAFTSLLTGEPLPPDAPRLDRDGMYGAFASVTAKLARERPVVMVIDDLHQAPEAGLGLFASLATAIRDQSVLLIGCGRRQLPAAWVANTSRAEHVAQLELERLTSPDLHRLLEDAVGSPRLARDLEPGIMLRSGGNPFFALEILGSLRDRGRLLRQTDGSWAANGPLDLEAIPSSIHDLIQSRLNRLTEGQRELLEIGCCNGDAFDPLLVAEVAGRERIPALRTLARVEADIHLVRSRGRQFVFDHHQVMEVLYAALAPLLREEYHGAIADVLEQRLESSERPRPDGALRVDICRHRLRSRRPTAVLAHLHSALDHLVDGHLGEEAIRMMVSVLAEPGVLSGEPRLRVLLRLNDSLGLSGRRDEQERWLEEATRLAEQIGDEASEGRVAGARGHFRFAQGRLEDATLEFEGCRDAARRRGDTVAEGRAETGLGLVAYRKSRFEDALRHFERHHRIATDAGEEGAAVAALGNMGIVLQALGRHEEALACAHQVLATAKAKGDLRMEGKCSDNLGILLQGLGRIDEARAHCARSVEIADRIGDRQSQAVGHVNLGSLLREQDHLEEAIESLQAALTIGHAIGDPVNQAIALDNLGMAARVLGDHAASARYLEEALDLCRQVGAKHDEGYVLENLGRLAEDEGRLTDARGLLEQAVGLRREISYPVGEASALAHLGRVLERQGESEQAAELLDHAIELAEKHGAITEHLRALWARAALPGGSVSDALEMLERCAQKVEREDLLRAHLQAWRVTADERHLRQARALLDHRIASAPTAHRLAMRKRVPLHRAILEASPD